VGQKFNRFIPAIRGVSLTSTATREYLQANIEQGRPGTQMPAWGPHAGGLLPEEITGVVEYLLSGAPAAPAMTALTLHGDASHGLSLFLRNCAGCHGMNGRGGIAPEIGNPVFQQAATEDFILRIIRNGRIGTAMPAFQRNDAPAFSDQDIADVLACLRTLGEPKRQKAMAQSATSGTPPGGKP
jgi:mono/diheme cytochrome c family protein